MVGWSSWSRDWDPVISSNLNVEYGELVFRYDGVGDAGWNNQVNYEGLKLEYGQTYRLTFSAKGDLERDFDVTFYDGAMNFRSAPMALGTEFADYEYIFTYYGGEFTKLSFELGAVTENSDGTVFWLDNVLLESLQQDDVLMNGEFDETGWSQWMADWNSTSATVDFTGGNIMVDVADVGTENWNIQVFQEWFELTQDQQYRVTFEAMSSVDRDINAKVIAADGTEYVCNVSLTDTMTEYTCDFTFAVATQNAKLDFELGGAQNGIAVAAPSVVTFDNLALEQFDGTAVVADTNVIFNGTLDQLYKWGAWTGEGATATFMQVDGMVKVEAMTLAAGQPSWGIQLYQDMLTIEKGINYNISFDIKADTARAIMVALGEPLTSDPWFLEFMPKTQVDVTTEWVHVVLPFTMALDTNENGKLVFELGNVNDQAINTVIYIDNVLISANYN